MIENIKSWSFSSLLSYEECPFRFYLKATGAELPEREPTRGELVHTMAEQYVRGELSELPKELKKFAEQFEQDRELYAKGELLLEEPWGFDRDLAPCSWEQAWLRMKLDQLVLLDGDRALRVVDLKTGKRYGNELKHIQQGQLYMIGVFLRYPDASLVEVVFRYLDEGKESNKRVYTRRDMEKFLPRWLERARAMTDNTMYKAKPNRITCRFCDYGVTNGSGACPYAVPWDAL